MRRNPGSVPALAALMLGIATSLAACGGGATTAGSGDGGGGGSGTTTVTVGVLPIVDVAPLYLGVDKGFFADEGIELNITPAQGGAALLPAVVSGEMQFAYSNVVSVMLAHGKGLPVQVVANGELSIPPDSPPRERPGEALLAAGDGSVTSVEDLHGKKVAVNTLENINEVLVKNAIDARGGDASKVELVELPMPEMPAALEQGRVAAAAMNEPYTSIALEQEANIVARPFTDVQHSASNIAVYFAKDAYVQQHPEVAESFVSALNKSLKYAQQHPEEVRDVIPSYTDIDQNLLDSLVLPYWTPELNRKSIDEIADLSVQYGVLESPVDLDELIGKHADQQS